MLSYCTNYLAATPDITVYMNCDTRLAVNLSLFELGERDEFIFAIKNYDYIDSSYAFLFRARKSDADANGDVIFKITPEESKALKPGAFYNCAILLRAFDQKEETEYIKITDNGKIILEYGAQDITFIKDEDLDNLTGEITGVRIEPLAAEQEG